MTETKQRAVIYCRISDKGQTGLGSQEHRCRQYAEAKGYDTANVFRDKVTGGGDFMKRAAMVELLKFLDSHPHENFVVIFDDLKRFARDTIFHLILRDEMKKRGAIRECLNFNFDDSIEGEFSETIHAAAGQLERKSIARQNRQKTIARMEAGFFAFSRPPIGYKYVKAKNGNNKVILPDEPVASIIRDALEGFASGRYASQAELARHLEANPRFPKESGRVRVQKVTNMLTHPLYAGYVGSKSYGVALRDGQHEGLISKATFAKIQDRIAGRANAPARKDLNRSFVLRGSVRCASCGNHLTASWPKGATKSYPYYLCQNKNVDGSGEKCRHYGKSIPRAKIEGEFEELLKSLQPSRDLIKAMVAMARVYWEQKVGQSKKNREAIKAEIKRIDAKIDQMVDKIVEITNARAITALENKIASLEDQKLILAEQASKAGAPQPTFKESLELPLRFFANHYNIWASGVFELRRLVLKLAFSQPPEYDRETGYRTPETSCIYRVFSPKSGQFLPVLENGAAGEN